MTNFTSLILAAALGSAVTVGTESVLEMHDPVFNPTTRGPGLSNTWEFRNASDNGVARVLVNAQGTDQGAVPDGYAEIALRSQDEIRASWPKGPVLASSDTHGMVRLMSKSYGATPDDPIRGHCRGSQCPETLEVYSDKHVRITAASDGVVDVVSGIRNPIAINRVGEGELAFPEIRAAAGGRNFLCIDATGRVYSNWQPCDQTK